MSESRSEKNNPENSGEPQEPVSTGSDTSGEHKETAGAKTAPWTSEVPQVPGPAPVIELDSPVESRPVKPLGPRRLARLQREMAEHAQEIHRAEQANAGEVDQDLLLKQQRFAELALRAAAANEQDRRDAQAALRAHEAHHGSGTDTGSGDTAAEETITVSFPENSPVGSSLAANPLTEDPGQFPSSPLDQASGPHTVSINVVAPAAEQAGSAAPATDGPAEPTAEGPAATTDGPAEPTAERRAATAEGPVVAAASEASAATTDGPATERAAASSSEETGTEPEVPATEAPLDPQPMPSERVSAPGTPVRAVDAEGLQLLDPKDYKQSSGALVPLLVLLFLVIAALIAVLIIFVL